MEAWHVWVIAAVVLFIAELLTPGFVLACFGVGAFGAAVAAAAGASLALQVVAFSAATLLVFWQARPVLVRYFQEAPAARTNVDALVGRVARVTLPIGPDTPGRVALDGDDWKAEVHGGRAVGAGERVRVVRVDSVTLIVEPLGAATPPKEG